MQIITIHRLALTPPPLRNLLMKRAFGVCVIRSLFNVFVKK